MGPFTVTHGRFSIKKQPFVTMSLLLLLNFLVAVGAAPAPSPVPEPLFGFNPIAPIADGLKGQLAKAASSIASTSPTATPKNIPEAVSMLKAVFGPKPTGLITSGIALAKNGLQVSGTLGTTINSPGAPGTMNSFNNTNPAPPTPVFPKANPADPAFSKTEKELRGFAGAHFEGNMIKIMAQNASIGQAVWLNVPGAMIDDVQTNAEFIAHAANYMATTTGKQISIVGWSQGNLATQWALKYWPSVRASTKQLVSFSPDFHGTLVAALTDLPIIDRIPLGPSLLQQKTNSNLIKTLRAGGGDSAYVPTTTIYSSSFDEVVQPQKGKGASAFLLDARGVGVSNNEIQEVCPSTPAGDFGTHESIMFNGLATELVIDALVNGGPADPKRMDLATICQNLAHPALDVRDVAKTEGTIPIAAVNILEFEDGVTDEPKIRAYARVN
ncbi:hypothetical protein PG995_006350 [Apiospora arundinis]